jgi:pyruvate/2-oxoglutarate dehydrogenase complex dihydrolipoamide acyltransferase (E2) component
LQSFEGVAFVSTQIILPKLGFSMNSGTVTEWLVADGARIEKGQPLYALESDKSVEEIQAPASGTLKILCEVGRQYDVGTVLGEIS